MERLASDVLENWTPDLPDVHPDDVPNDDTTPAYGTDGEPLLKCPLVPDGANDGAIEGAGGTWWRPKSSAWSVEPSRIRALSPKGRAWLKATHARLAHYTEMGATDQNLSAFNKACRASHGRAGRDAVHVAQDAGQCVQWTGCDPVTGAVVLRLFYVTKGQASALVEGYGVAGRALTLRPA